MSIEEKLNEPVNIHFKEDGIPGIRRGVLTDGSKAALLAIIAEANVELLESLLQEQRNAMPIPNFIDSVTNRLVALKVAAGKDTA